MNIKNLKKIITDRKAHSDWVKACKTKGYTTEKIASLNREMSDALFCIESGHKINTNNKRVWLKWSLDCGDYVEIPLKDNENVEIYLSNLGFCQVLARDNQPVASHRYSEGSDFAHKSAEVYGVGK